MKRFSPKLWSPSLRFPSVEVGTVEPHVFVEFYAGEGDPEFFNNEEHTQAMQKRLMAPHSST